MRKWIITFVFAAVFILAPAAYATEQNTHGGSDTHQHEMEHAPSVENQSNQDHESHQDHEEMENSNIWEMEPEEQHEGEHEGSPQPQATTGASHSHGGEVVETPPNIPVLSFFAIINGLFLIIGLYLKHHKKKGMIS